MRFTRAAIVFLFTGTIVLAEAQHYVISTYAGGVPPPTPATGINLSIGYPKAMAVDAAGNAYFIALNCVFKVDQNGIVTRIAGNSLTGYSGDGGPAVNAQLQLRSTNLDRLYISNLPPGITVDNAGNVYVADNGNSRIRRISLDGTITTVAGTGTFGFSGDGGPATSAQLSNVLGMAVDTAGNLLIADADNNRVRLVGQDGSIISIAGDGSCGFSGDGGPAASAQLCSPAGMATDNSGNVLFADTRNNRIRGISPDRTITTAAGNGLWQPTSVSVDGAGNLFIANTDADGYDAWQVVRHPPQSGWLDELGRLKGGWPVGLGVARCAPQ
jgi:sugar lactone lactonase YvrE